MNRRKFAITIGKVVEVQDINEAEKDVEKTKIKIIDGVISNLEWEMMQLEEVPLELADEEWGNL